MKLKELAPVIRSKNAGPFWYTVDVIFDNPELYEAVKKSKIITKELVAKRYNNIRWSPRSGAGAPVRR